MRFKENPLYWWKREADNFFSRGRFINEIYEMWRLKEFEKYIATRPFSREYAKYILYNRTNNLSLHPRKTSFLLPLVNNLPKCFDIIIADSPLEEIPTALSHELIHAFYRFKGSHGGLDSSREQVVEKEAKRFCKDNPEFIKTFCATIPSQV